MKLQDIFLSVIVAILGVMFSSCEDNADETGLRPTLQNKYLDVVLCEGDLTFPKSSGRKVICIVTLGVPWQISNLPDWITVDKASGTSIPQGFWYGGDNVTITTMENDVPEERTAVFCVTAYGNGWTLTQNVEVTQLGGNPYISFPVSYINVSGNAHNRSIEMDTNCPNMILSCSESWVTATYDKTARKVNLTFEENRTNYNRMVKIEATYSYLYAHATLTVTQSPSSSE